VPGAILVLAVMVTPAAAAAQVTSNPVKATVLSVLFAETALLGGIVLSLGPGLPISGYVATIVFLWWVICRIVGRVLRSRGRSSPPENLSRGMPSAPSWEAANGAAGARADGGSTGVAVQAR